MKLDFGVAVALLISIPLILVGCYFLFYNYRELDESDDVKDKAIEQCPFCTHVFYITFSEHIWMCPRCKSLVHDQGKGAKR